MGGVCKVIFMSNPTVVLRLGWGFDNFRTAPCSCRVNTVGVGMKCTFCQLVLGQRKNTILRIMREKGCRTVVDGIARDFVNT